MIESGNGINAIRYSNKMYPPQDQQLIEFEDNYVFKTNPSFQLSQQTSKHMPKSQNWFHTKQDTNNHHHQQQSTGIQRKKRNRNKKQSIDQSPINPQFLQSTNNHQKKIRQLTQEVSKLRTNNMKYENENDKLKQYIEFLQDYNMKLKRQLMTALRRRNIQQQLQPFTQHFAQPFTYQTISHSLQKSPRQQMFQSKYIPKMNMTNGANQWSNKYPYSSSLLQVPFDNNKLSPQQFKAINRSNLYNSNNNNTMSYPHQHVNSSAFTNKYISQFQQLPQKQSPYYWSYKLSKKIKNNPLRKILPTSLQSSMLGRQNHQQSLQQSYQHSNNYQHLNASMPIVKNYNTPDTHHEQQYLQNINVPSNEQNHQNHQNMLRSQNFRCIKCSQNQQNHRSKQRKLTEKTSKNKKSTKNQKITNKNNNFQQFLCHVHNQNQSKKSQSIRSTLPTRSKTLDQSSRQKKYNTKKSNNLNSSKSRTSKYGQKVTISQFCV